MPEPILSGLSTTAIEIIIASLMLLIGVILGGKKFMDLFKKSEVNVYQNDPGSGNPPTCSLFSPDQCKAHEAEHNRSIRNEADIAKLDREADAFREEVGKKLDDIGNGVTDIKVSLAETKAALNLSLKAGVKQ